MNGQSVWIGHEYAYVHQVRRGIFPMSAQRVKVQSIRKVQQYGKSRDDTLARVEFVEQGITREVNVRNLHDFWDSYSDERNAHKARREEQEAERNARYEADRAKAREAEAKKNSIRVNLGRQLGIDPAGIHYDNYTQRFTIRYSDLKFLEE